MTALASLTAALLLWFGFVTVLFVLRKIVPGPICAGRPLADGAQKLYKLNGLSLFAIVAGFILATGWTGVFSLAILRRFFWQLFVAANLFAIVHTVFLLVRGRRKGSAESPGRGLLRDVWFGIELNPTAWDLDLKLFGYIPSLLSLWTLNLSFAVAQWHELGHVTSRVVLYETFFTIYVFNYFQFERGMLHTWDVMAENFGWMLVWGDYVLVPFFYSIGGWYVVRNTDPMPVTQVLFVITLFAVGMWLFRGANQQKHRFKEQPGRPIWGRPPESLDGKLLLSGFWGIGRKLNYTGELLVYLSWTLCTGFQSVVPYMLPLWLLCLFVQRAARDEERCHAKYGDLWLEYRRRVPFRMIPFVY